MAEQSLKHKAASGMIWSAIQKYSTMLIKLISGMILARLLMPEDYGAIGMLLIFISLAEVFIAAGAQVLHKVKIGDGAVIGGGAVVTHDVPPYAIAVGIPAKVIGYRCAPEFIERLEKIQWWNWPDEVLRENIDWLIHSDINEETISKMEEVSSALSNQ